MGGSIGTDQQCAAVAYNVKDKKCNFYTAQPEKIVIDAKFNNASSIALLDQICPENKIERECISLPFALCQSLTNLGVDYVSYRNNPLIRQSKVVSRKVLAAGSSSDSQSSSKACRLPDMLRYVIDHDAYQSNPPAKVFVFVCCFWAHTRTIVAVPSWS